MSARPAARPLRALWGSLYGRISAIFVVLLLAFAVVQGVLWVHSARNFAQESDQGLNRLLAHDLISTFQPALANGLDREAMGEMIHNMMVYNPRIEIYILDRQGTILAYFTDPANLELMTVNLAPVRRFLAGPPGPLPIVGDDPRNAGVRKPFSAAPIRIGDEPGYLYLILSGEQYESVAAMVEKSYIVRNGVIVGAVTFVLIGLVGLLSFFLVTKRLRAMVGAVRAFEHGDLHARTHDPAQDEIGQLGRAFNDMADKVEDTLEQLRLADGMRRELLANVSHDLRSPLASVQGYLETLLMKDRQLPFEERRRFLEIVHANVGRLIALVNELLELSKLESGRIEPQVEPFSLPELVQDVLLKFEPLALERHITLGGELPRDLPLVLGDVGLIDRVLVNLFDNALRYTPRDGQVTVHLRALDGGVRVEVADTGCGIPVADQAHIFERFYRVDKSRSRDSGGSGIGLTIVQRILEAHGQPITVESAPGQGARFRFDLPAQRPGP